MHEIIGWTILTISGLLLVQSLFSLYLIVYTWWQPDRLVSSQSPDSFLEPEITFTVLLPARHEKAVIYQTIRRILSANYPEKNIQILVICEEHDAETIAEARRAFELIDSRRVGVLTFSDGPVNKPHGLNVGLEASTNQVVTVFDAEDDIHPDIFNVINTIMLQEKVRVVQSGVQLMNYDDHWFSSMNVLEYFFWFRSRLHFHSKVGMIPLGGNTVFVNKELLLENGGWDEHCLTEDAALGICLSVKKEPIRVVYDAQHVTREETPSTLGSFVKQRTRWSQGFLQLLFRGEWLKLPTFGQRLLAFYTLSNPILQCLMFIFWPLSCLMFLFVKLPILYSLPAYAPFYSLLLGLIIYLFGLWEFTRLYSLRFSLLLPFKLALAYIPFNLVLGYSAARAVIRQLANRQDWEKTRHAGAHREQELAQVAVSGKVELPVALNTETLEFALNQPPQSELASEMRTEMTKEVSRDF